MLNFTLSCKRGLFVKAQISKPSGTNLFEFKTVTSRNGSKKLRLATGTKMLLTHALALHFIVIIARVYCLGVIRVSLSMVDYL